MSNYYSPSFYRIDFVVIPSYIELCWIKQEVSEASGKEIKKREGLQPTACFRIQNYQKQENEMKDSQGELEQYGRTLCIRINGVTND